jgi:hypothetical protein
LTTHSLDPSASKLVVRTRAEGLLARLAHDLEIVATEIRGHASIKETGWTAEILIPVVGLRVAGTLHGDRLDEAALSQADRQEIERRMRDEVLAGTREVRVRASGSSRDRAVIRVELSSGSAETQARLRAGDATGGAVEVWGDCPLSLRALGIREVKAPLGAFKIRDQLEIRFDVTLRPEP